MGTPPYRGTRRQLGARPATGASRKRPQQARPPNNGGAGKRQAAIALNVETIDCRALIEDVTVGLRPLAENKGLDLATIAPADPLEVHADRRVLTQILINLANNAITFTDRGAVRVRLSRQTREQTSLTLFSVTDTGCGIKPDDQDRLFAPFQQLGSRVIGPDEGTGLGLHICQTLATSIGATITFDSTFGEGSTFTLELPG